MWPKAFAQLVELAPHLSRILPMADRFFQTKAANEDANRKAISDLGDRLRADLNQVTVAHATLSDQVSDISSAVHRLASDSASVKLSTDAVDGRLKAIEARQSRLQALLAVALVLLVVVLILSVILLLHGR